MTLTTRPLVAALAAGLLLTACRTGPAIGPSPTPAPSATASADPAQALHAFANCLRIHGIPANDTTISVKGAQYRGLKLTEDVDPTKLRVAAQACKSLWTPSVTKDPVGTMETYGKFLKDAYCLRAHGLDAPDPIEVADGGLVTPPAAGVTGEPASWPPAAKAAWDACKSLLPARAGSGA
jgi:hypothetical protein